MIVSMRPGGSTPFSLNVFFGYIYEKINESNVQLFYLSCKFLLVSNGCLPLGTRTLKFIINSFHRSFHILLTSLTSMVYLLKLNDVMNVFALKPTQTVLTHHCSGLDLLVIEINLSNSKRAKRLRSNILINQFVMLI